MNNDDKFIDDTLEDLALEKIQRGRAKVRAKREAEIRSGKLEEFLSKLEQKGIDPESPDGRRIMLRWLLAHAEGPDFRASFREGFNDD